MYESANTGGGKRRWAAALGLLTAGAISGGILAGTLTASASSQASTASASTASSSGSHPRMPGPGGAQPVRQDEKSVSGATAAKLRAAALKAVPGGTVYRIETDAGDGAYEGHMKKADGSLVTVKFDQDLKVTKVESGMGAGDPALGTPGGSGGQGSQGAPGSAA